MNRSNKLPAFILVLFFALLLLLTGSSVLSWAPEPTSESKEATRQADAKVLTDEAVDVTKEVPVDSQVVDLSQDPRAVQVSENDQQKASPVDATLNKIPRNIRGVQTHLKHHIHQAFNRRTFFRHRPTEDLVTRFHSWLVGELGLTRTTHTRHWKETRINGQTIKKRQSREFAFR